MCADGRMDHAGGRKDHKLEEEGIKWLSPSGLGRPAAYRVRLCGGGIPLMVAEGMRLHWFSSVVVASPCDLWPCAKCSDSILVGVPRCVFLDFPP